MVPVFIGEISDFNFWLLQLGKFQQTLFEFNCFTGWNLFGFLSEILFQSLFHDVFAYLLDAFQEKLFEVWSLHLQVGIKRSAKLCFLFEFWWLNFQVLDAFHVVGLEHLDVFYDLVLEVFLFELVGLVKEVEEFLKFCVLGR